MIFANRVHALRSAPCAMLVACLLAGSAATAAAQTTESRMEGLNLSSDKPIQIASDKLEVEDKDGTAVFTGNVQVVQGDTLMRSNVMTVHYEKRQPKEGDNAAAGSETAVSPGANSQIERIEVDGNVYIKSGKQEARAQSGVFNMKTEIMELFGSKDDKVVLTEDNNVFTGCKLTVYMKNSNALLDSCPNARIEIVLDPKSQRKGEGGDGQARPTEGAPRRKNSE